MDPCPVVIVTRHPDFANTFQTFYGDVEIIDVDLGCSDLSDPEEYAEWRESMMVDVARLRERGLDEAADALESGVDEADGTKS